MLLIVCADPRPLPLGQLTADPRAARSLDRPACPPGVHHCGDCQRPPALPCGQRLRPLAISLRSVQSGKTCVGELGVCHIIANLPGPTLWLDQTDDDAKDQAESRLRDLAERCCSTGIAAGNGG